MLSGPGRSFPWGGDGHICIRATVQISSRNVRKIARAETWQDFKGAVFHLCQIDCALSPNLLEKTEQGVLVSIGNVYFEELEPELPFF